MIRMCIGRGGKVVYYEKGTFIGMSESRKGITNGAETATGPAEACCSEIAFEVTDCRLLSACCEALLPKLQASRGGPRCRRQNRQHDRGAI
jgi:hypothetical protein